jgi:cytochrome c-type biogenesis protein CcmH/NrfG
MSAVYSIWWSVIVPSIVALTATLTAPWAKWGVQKQKALLDNRRSRVAEWRKAIQSASTFEDVRLSVFQELRRHMNEEEVKSFSRAWVTIGPMGVDGEKAKLAKLSSVINNIEKKWKLI